MKPNIWIIDTEWDHYEIEKAVLKEGFGDVNLYFSGDDYLADAKKYASKADAIICQVNMMIDRELILKLDQCKIISVYGVGYNNVDVKAAAEREIAVANVPTYCTEDVADYVIAAIYHCNKTLLEYSDHVLDSPWGAMAAKTLIHRIEGSTLFIIGYGNIGQQIAKKALKMKMQVICYDPYIKDEVIAQTGAKKVELEDGLRLADYVSLNLKFTEDTKDFMNIEKFKEMKPNAFFINASRGGTVDEDALMKSVKEHVIAGACLDVLKEEPPKPDCEILHTDNVFVTPHISYLTQTSLDELQKSAAENVVVYLKGEAGATLVK